MYPACGGLPALLGAMVKTEDVSAVIMFLSDM
jgi:hypothetical protein